MTWQAVLRRRTAVVSRWLHVYLSMVSFAIVFFFSVTGFTLNHTDWFAAKEQTTRSVGTMPAKWLKEPAKLEIVEQLRNQHKIHGAMSDFRIEDAQLSVSFKGPGYTADSFIDRDTGKYEVIETRNGFLAVMNDLHKGRDTGKVWSAVIDASALLLVLVSFTGLVLLFFLYKRRTAGLILGAFGAIFCIALYKLFVP